MFVLSGNVVIQLIKMSYCWYDVCLQKYSFDVRGKKRNEENKYAHLKLATTWWSKREKDGLNRKRNPERNGETGVCAVSFDRGPLQCYQMEASEWSVSHTHTHTLSLSLSLLLCLTLFPLVSFQSRDQPLADRTGPLGSCYRPPERRDWKALIAALRSPQSRENHSISVIGSPCLRQREEREGGSRHKERIKGRFDT